MRILIYSSATFFIVLWLSGVLGSHGCPRQPDAKAVSIAKNLFNALTSYACDNSGKYPETADVAYLNECEKLEYISEGDISSYILNDAPEGSTGFFYFNGQTQASPGNNLLVISEKPIFKYNNVPVYITVRISGKAEALTYEELVPLLAQTIRHHSR